jgi:uncharacterized protein (DUF1330 family)
MKLTIKTLICALAVMSTSMARAQQGPLNAYLISETRVADAKTYKLYSDSVQAALTPYRGRFIVKGGETVSLEGGEPVGRIVVIEFPSMQSAKAFWKSDAYRAIKPLRIKSAKARIFLVEGNARNTTR